MQLIKSQIRLCLSLFIALLLIGCNASSSQPVSLTIAISGGVYGETDPCG